jgi:hypothetical protein
MFNCLWLASSSQNILKAVGFEVFTAVVLKSIIFWDITPCSPLSCTRRSSETSGTTQRTTRRHIPEDDTLHLESRLSVKFQLIFLVDEHVSGDDSFESSCSLYSGLCERWQRTLQSGKKKKKWKAIRKYFIQFLLRRNVFKLISY